ncbi:hypothetical protein BJX76DRAFT_335550, partial [Aspergillus varians]
FFFFCFFLEWTIIMEGFSTTSELVSSFFMFCSLFFSLVRVSPPSSYLFYSLSHASTFMFLLNILTANHPSDQVIA